MLKITDSAHFLRRSKPGPIAPDAASVPVETADCLKLRLLRIDGGKVEVVFAHTTAAGDEFDGVNTQVFLTPEQQAEIIDSRALEGLIDLVEALAAASAQIPCERAKTKP